MGYINKANIKKEKYYLKPLKSMALLTAQTIGATLFTLPFAMLTFGQISLISPLANVLVMGLSQIALILSCLLVLAGLMHLAPLIHLVAFLNGLVLDSIQWIIRILAQIPFATISTRYDYVKLWLGLGLIFVAVAMLLGRRRPSNRQVSLLLIITLYVGISSYQLFNLGTAVVEVLDVGDGCAVLIQKGGNAVLIGCGGDDLPQSKVNLAMKLSDIAQLDAVVLPDEEDIFAAKAPELMVQNKAAVLVRPQNGGREFDFANLQLENTQVIYTGRQKLTVNHNIEVFTFAGEVGAAKVLVGNITVLIVSRNVCIHNLPISWRKCDILVCAGVAPRDLNRIRTELVVFSGDPLTAAKNVRAMGGNNAQMLSTSGEGAVEMTLRSNGKMMIRRGE